MTSSIKISPSILSADFSKLGAEIVSLDKAGADILAPSDMGELTVKNLHAETEKKVMAYVKWRSVFYSSFRELANSNPSANELTK